MNGLIEAGEKGKSSFTHCNQSELGQIINYTSVYSNPTANEAQL